MNCKCCKKECVLMSMMQDEYHCTQSDHKYQVIYDEGENIVFELLTFKKEIQDDTRTPRL